MLDFDGFDDFDSAVVKILGFANENGSNKRCAGGAGNRVIAHGKVGNGGTRIDLGAVDALDEETIGVEFSGASGFEAFLRAGFFPDFGKFRGVRLGGSDGGYAIGWHSGAKCGDEGGNKEVVADVFHGDREVNGMRKERKHGICRAVEWRG